MNLVPTPSALLLFFITVQESHPASAIRGCLRSSHTTDNTYIFNARVLEKNFPHVLNIFFRQERACISLWCWVVKEFFQLVSQLPSDHFTETVFLIQSGSAATGQEIVFLSLS